MVRFVLSVVVWLCLGFATFGQIDSVCKVDSGNGWGSGWVAAKVKDREDGTYYGVVITARHCVIRNDGSLAILTVEFPGGWKCENCTVICFDSDDDCAAVWCILPDSIIPLEFGEVKWGGDVGNYGLATGVDVDWGVVTVADEHAIWSSAAVTPGDSGGPLCNRSGQVVGLMTHKILCEADGCKSRACAAQPIRELLSRAIEVKTSKQGG